MPRAAVGADNFRGVIGLAEINRPSIYVSRDYHNHGPETKMRYLKTLLASGALVSALFSTGCAFNPQAVNFNHGFSLAASPVGNGKTVSLIVKDERADQALGRRGTAYGAAAAISTTDKLDEVVRDKCMAGLKQLGFQIDPSSDRKLQVELRLLNYGTSTGFWSGGIETKGAIKVLITYGTDKFEKNYNAEAEERVMVVPTAEHNAELINQILDLTLMKVFANPEFRSFMAK